MNWWFSPERDENNRSYNSLHLYCVSLGAGFSGFTSFIGYDISKSIVVNIQDDLFEDKIYDE
jgi:hypothetical protein